MKAYDLLHGALMGACYAGLASLLEAAFLFADYPYQTAPATWSAVLPTYLLCGAALGLLCALFLPLFARNAKLRPDRRVILASMILCAGLALVLVLQTRMSWIPVAVPTTSTTVLLRMALVLVGSAVLFWLLTRMARGRLHAHMCSWFGAPVTSTWMVLVLLAAGVACLLPTTDSELTTKDRNLKPLPNSPNVMLIVLDTVAAGHLGTYGYERDTSPRLDALASEGAVFVNNFSAAPWTLPSHASIFSGLHPNNHGTGWEKPRLSDGIADVEQQARYDFHTLAEEMARLGYDTCGVSEKAWLSSASGLTQGFETYYDYSNPQLIDGFLLRRVWDRYRHKIGCPAPKPFDKGGSGVVDKALDWLGGNRERDESRPFFLFMNLNEAHDPYEPPEEFWSAFLPEGVDIEDTKPPTLRSDVLLHREVLLGEAEISDEEMALYECLYDAEILYQDGLLGRLFDGLEGMGLKDDTLIIITADHGEEFGEIDGRVGHQLSLSDYLLHVPLIMRYPARIPAGRRVEALSSTVDIFPTILDVLEQERGFTIPKSREIFALEGVSQLGTMQEGGTAARDMVMAHYSNPAAYLSGFLQWDASDPWGFELAHHLRAMDIIRTSDDKLYMYADGDRAYVSFLDDPTEQGSTAKKVIETMLPRADFLEWRFDRQLNSHVVMKELLTGNLNWFRGATGKTAGQDEEVDTTGMTQQEIEALGYVGANAADGTLAEEKISLPPFLKR